MFTIDISTVKHNKVICCKVLKILDCILHFSSEFHLLFFLNLSPLKSLYYPLVCPVLRYSSILCDLSTVCACITIERVQRKFLRITTHKLNIPHSPYRFTLVLHIFNIYFSAYHRYESSQIYLSYLLFSYSLLFLSLINFQVPSHTTCLNHNRCSFSNFLDNSSIFCFMRT